ncbi:MAG: glutamate racemase, partial [Ignavibacteriae bacterium]|nr:glutamate racemase [Ignavibacteriota bacterium]
MSTTSQPIGVFDSGVGGLSVLRHLVKILPNERYIYLGDTARVPYGNKSEETIREYTEQAVRFLVHHNAKLIIIACNTASAIALNVAESVSNVPVIGMIIPAAEAAVSTTKNGKIGIIGTRATIGSKAYPQTIAAYDSEKNIEVIGKACPLFVPLAEEGFHVHLSAELIINEYLSPLSDAGIDTLVLGCTHYPLLAPLIKLRLPTVKLIDCGEYAANEAHAMLETMNLLSLVNTNESLPN